MPNTGFRGSTGTGIGPVGDAGVVPAALDTGLLVQRVRIGLVRDRLRGVDHDHDAYRATRAASKKTQTSDYRAARGRGGVRATAA